MRTNEPGSFTLHSRNANGKILYVSQLPGDGGVDWGYTSRPGDALHVSGWWRNKYIAENVPGRGYTYWDTVPAQTKTRRKSNPARRKSNPRPRIGTAKATRASSATGKPPSKRLKARRKANSRKGYFPNPNGQSAHPRKLVAPAARANAPYAVQFQYKTGAWITVNNYATETAAVYDAKRLAKFMTRPIRAIKK